MLRITILLSILFAQNIQAPTSSVNSTKDIHTYIRAQINRMQKSINKAKDFKDLNEIIAKNKDTFDSELEILYNSEKVDTKKVSLAQDKLDAWLTYSVSLELFAWSDMASSPTSTDCEIIKRKIEFSYSLPSWESTPQINTGASFAKDLHKILCKK